MINGLKKYWKNSKQYATWAIAFRKRDGQKTILSNLEGPFFVPDLPKDTWAADPFVFSFNGEEFLFYEWFLEKKKKGVIACSKISELSITTPQLVLEEDFHLSFPCIFVFKDDVYMIPETGAKESLMLYKCKRFPLEWTLEKVLLNGYKTSDTIVYLHNNNVFVFASIIKNNASTVNNILFKLNMDNQELEKQLELADVSNIGLRNAGLFFENFGSLIRPGQYCEDNDYGKALTFWNVIKIDDNKYEESFIRNVDVKDVRLVNNNTNNYSGIHTYNLNNYYETIDLKILHRRSFFKRIKWMFQVIFDYVKRK